MAKFRIKGTDFEYEGFVGKIWAETKADLDLVKYKFPVEIVEVIKPKLNLTVHSVHGDTVSVKGNEQGNWISPSEILIKANRGLFLVKRPDAIKIARAILEYFEVDQ